MNNIYAGISISCLAVGLANPAMAQDSRGSSDISDIIVTARRVEERLQDVPISISVVSQSQIADRNITTASELSQYVPSLSTDQRYGGDATTFNIRGFFQENVSTPTVGVYFADAIAPRGNSITNTPSGDGVGAGNMFDLQNVQVLKGPQGTLFGRNTTGGVIMFVPTKPTWSLEGYVELSAGNYGLDRQQAVLNVPLSDTFRFRVGFDRQQRDGWQKNISGIGPDRFGSSDYFALRASIVGDLTPDLENYIIASYSKSDPVPAINSILDCNPAATSPTGLPGLVQAFGFCTAYQQRRAAGGFYSVQNPLDAPVKQSSEQWQIINTTTWKASDHLTIKNIAAYSQFVSNFRSTIFGENYIVDPASVPAGSSPAVLALATKYAGSRFFVAQTSYGATGDSASQSTFSNELQFQGNSGNGKLNWQGGLYLEMSDPIDTSASQGLSAIACTNSSFNEQCADFFRDYVAAVVGFPVAFIPSVAKKGNNFSRINYRDYGIYAQATYKFTDQLALTGGIRYSKDTMSGEASQQDLVGFPVNGTYGTSATARCFFVSASLANGCVQTYKSSSEKPTGLIDLEYTPTRDLLFYGKYTRGYRQGGIQPRSPTPSYGPETVDAYEAGSKVTFRGGGISGTFNLAVFYNVLKNQQLQASFSVDNVFFQSLLNVGKSRVYGVEMDSDLRAGIFSLNAAAAYLNTKIVDAPSSAALVPLIQSYVGAGHTIVISTVPNQGDPLPLAPKWRVTLTPSIDLPIPDNIGKLTLSGTMVYTSETFVTSADGYTGPNSSLNHNEATTLFNANLNWKGVGGTPIDLSTFVTNLTNKKYIAAYLGGWINAAGSETGRQGMPRMYGVRLRYRFGE
ncbi:Outer membrane receptor proteins, mostly Fe transport [Novosphingobium sp. CF614]|uniref:TonB-dependent receptor n=1 Tax=Novosphingobium sp. CF614 TaxID=1884364 RepID=UPI0008F36E24|nr:TonB-dependent receptor [Novosphingobium sp. CF614]SFG00756.1 Outer membrane receptor proteins, mostly Fe transport [Novosphingobium sp. CF614]